MQKKDLDIIKNVQQKLKETNNNTFPRNIVAFCNELNIKVRETNEMENNISGLICKNGTNYEILINANQSIGRKAFTIAHELGHYFLHRENLDNESEIVSFSKGRHELCEATTMARVTSFVNISPEYRKMESEANEFAAQILMPENEFLDKCMQLDSIDDVAAHFGVSISAATIRADRVGCLYFL